MNELGSTVTLERPFSVAVEAVIAARASEGFGVISRIDLDKAFAEKLGREIRLRGPTFCIQESEN